MTITEAILRVGAYGMGLAATCCASLAYTLGFQWVFASLVALMLFVLLMTHATAEYKRKESND